MSNLNQPAASAKALLPLTVFLILFFGAGIGYTATGHEMGFYQLHAPVAILPAIALALWLGRKQTVSPRETLFQGMGEPRIMLMCLIFLLAGAFGNVSAQTGGVEAAVYAGMSLVPHSFLLPGLFLAAAMVSLAMGTSMGTIAAVAPIAVGLAEAAGLSLPLTIGTVVGGAMFGDNLSVISDTTIAATQTQGAAMRDKFRENIWLALPAAVLTFAVLAFMPFAHEGAQVESAPLILALPYLVVLVLAVAGVNVLIVLALGIVMSGGIGLIMLPEYSIASWFGDIWAGFESLFEIMLLSMLVGGLGNLMHSQGGLTWVVQQIERLGGRHAGRRTGEVSIGLLGAVADVLIANNTVAILLTGPIAKRLADKHGIQASRSASVLDIFACVIQGLLPYGAQLLLAAAIAGLSPLAIAGHVHYCWILAVVTTVALVWGWPRRRLQHLDTPPTN